MTFSKEQSAALAVGTGSASVAWEVEINYMTCIVFAATKSKAKWIAVKSYRDAYSRNGSWPHTSITRRPQYDRFPYRERKAYSPEYVRELC
jgi:hypothetical protein